MSSRYALLICGLILSLCPVLLPQTVLAQTPPPVFVEIRDFAEEDDRFVFVVALTNPRRVHKLYVELWSQNQRVAPPKEYENPQPLVRDAVSKEFLRPGREYEIIVRASDVRDEMIPLPSDKQDERPQTILARHPFTYVVADPDPIEFDIRAVIPNQTLGILYIDLSPIDDRTAARVESLEGYILDGNKQMVDGFRFNGLADRTLQHPLPQAMMPNQQEKKFTVQIDIITREGLTSTSDPFELTIPAIPPPTFRERVADLWMKLQAGIVAEPLIFIGILIVLINTFAWMLLRPRRKRKTVLGRPPVDTTNIELPAAKMTGTSQLQVKITRTPLRSNRKSHAFSGSAISIGRSPDCSLPISGDDRLSSIHVEIRLSGKRVELRDCNSKNGTYVNNVKIPSKQWLEIASHDKIRLGTRTEIQLAVRS